MYYDLQEQIIIVIIIIIIVLPCSLLRNQSYIFPCKSVFIKLFTFTDQ